MCLRNIFFNQRPGLCSIVHCTGSSQGQNIPIISFASSKKLERQDIFQLRNIYLQISIGLPISWRAWPSNLVNNERHIIIKPVLSKLLFLGNGSDCLLNSLIHTTVIRCDNRIYILCNLSIPYLSNHYRTAQEHNSYIYMHIGKFFAKKTQIEFNLCTIHLFSHTLYSHLY